MPPILTYLLSGTFAVGLGWLTVGVVRLGVTMWRMPKNG